ncbi:lipopolysaccharide biosynthesis protein RfbH [Desulfovibrio sp. TomC]|uniref:lipopolysaccharide biosynthesis protein RfbH n=1 Tax=Desulfovibrio sp. TomC TaxID=1562888 RepID=UPI00069D1D63|nr:lipopolysaccharide biosynthesis protein RfbH [Desulfovibrio sp. TomC]
MSKISSVSPGNIVRHDALPGRGVVLRLQDGLAYVVSEAAGGSDALDGCCLVPQATDGALPLRLDLWNTQRLAVADCEPLGALAPSGLDLLFRALGRQAAKGHYGACHTPGVFTPDVSPVPVSGKCYGAPEMENLVEAGFDFWLTTGRFNDAFEARLADWLGRKFCLTANSGSSANLLAIAALTSPKLEERRLRPGDEVLTVAAGFPTTVAPLVQCGLVPVFLDVDPATGNVRPEQLEAAVTDKTRLIFLAHTLGNPFDVAAVMAVARTHNLWVVEDCCDALGSRYARDGLDGMCGGFGHIATFSFYPAHHITMGEGGAVATDDPLLRKILMSFRDWGRDCWCPPGVDNTCSRRFDWKFPLLPAGYDHKYVYSHLGYNLKITDMQAAVGLAQLDRLDGFIQDRKRNFAYLTEALADLEGPWLTLPKATPGSAPSWFGYLMTLGPEAGNREELLQYMAEHKIGTRLLFAGNILRQPCAEGMPHRVAAPLDGTDVILRRSFWIGLYPGLCREQLDHAATCLRRWLTSGKRA